MSPRPVEGVSEEPKRWRHSSEEGMHFMGEHPDGEYVAFADYAALLSSYKRLRAERERYEKALRKYGSHQRMCPISDFMLPRLTDESRCICGLDAALSASAPDTK